MLSFFKKKDPSLDDRTTAAALVEMFADRTEGALKVYLEDCAVPWNDIRCFGSEDQKNEAFMVAEAFQMGFTRTFVAYSKAGTLILDPELHEEVSQFAWEVVRARIRRNDYGEDFLNAVSGATQNPGTIRTACKRGMDEGTKFVGFMTTGNDDLVDVSALKRVFLAICDRKAEMADPCQLSRQQSA